MQPQYISLDGLVVGILMPWWGVGVLVRKPKFYLLPSSWMVMTYLGPPLSGTWVSLLIKPSLSNNTYSVYVRLAVSNSVESVLSVTISSTMLSKLNCASVLSRIDYCNSLIAGCPPNLICKLQKVQNKAARLSRSVRSDHILSPILRALHWLPVESRI